jgi:hypothetical protein
VEILNVWRASVQKDRGQKVICVKFIGRNVKSYVDSEFYSNSGIELEFL